MINTPSGVMNNNCGGTLTATAGTGIIQLIGGTIPGGSGSTPGTCTLVVDVTSAITGSHVNTLAAGALTTSNGNNATATEATLTVNPPVGPGVVAPTVGKSFSLETVNPGETSTLTIIMSNSSTDFADTSATLTDTLPAGLVIASPNGVISDCGFTVMAPEGTGTIVLSGGTIPVGNGTMAGTCTVKVNVTAAAGGSYLNTLAAGALVTTSNNATNVSAAPTSATLIVNPVAPTLSKSFTPSTIFAGGGSTLTITLSNPNAIDATGAALLDALPNGVVIAASPNTINTCGGTLTAIPGTGIIQLIGGTILADSICTVTVNVSAAAGGSFLNMLPANALQTSNGNNTVPAAATLTVKPFPAPMLSGWALIMLTALLAMVGFAAMRRQAM